MKKKLTYLFLTLFCSIGISGCNDNKGPGGMILNSRESALPTMEHIALTANKCWFKSADPAFKAYRLAPELKSFSNKPRILVVPYNNPGGKPLLVVEATGEPTRVSIYGPLMDEKNGNRIAENIYRWMHGNSGC